MSEENAATFDELRNELISWLEEMDDEDAFLPAVHALVGNYVGRPPINPIMGYRVNGEPVRVKQFLREAEESIAEVKRGGGYTLEEVRERLAARWEKRGNEEE